MTGRGFDSLKIETWLKNSILASGSYYRAWFVFFLARLLICSTDWRCWNLAWRAALSRHCTEAGGFVSPAGLSVVGNITRGEGPDLNSQWKMWSMCSRDKVYVDDKWFRRTFQICIFIWSTLWRVSHNLLWAMRGVCFLHKTRSEVMMKCTVIYQYYEFIYNPLNVCFICGLGIGHWRNLVTQRWRIFVGQCWGHTKR